MGRIAKQDLKLFFIVCCTLILIAVAAIMLVLHDK